MNGIAGSLGRPVTRGDGADNGNPEQLLCQGCRGIDFRYNHLELNQLL